MNSARDQVLLGLALQNGLINHQQALLVKERHQQFFQANRPVSVSAILRALKLVSDQELQRLEKAADESASQLPVAATAAAARPATAATSPAPAGRRSTGSTPAAPAANLARTPQPGHTPLASAPVRRATDAAPAATTTAQPVPPGGAKMLGKYRILSQLGQGGMGAVYLAEDTHLNRKVALKVLPKDLAANRDFIKRFLAEARVTGKLSHPNIVVAYDIDSSQGLWYMAMEYLEGESIGNRLKHGERISWRDALVMIKQVSKGLAYAHKTGIVHRDIKPDNLFLDKASGEAKILDMGLSKNLHASENSSLTQAGMILGTPNYLAPEQAENGINVDNRADIYSLGATLFHMLTGAPPFDGPTPLAIIQKHLFEPMPDVRKSRPEAPSDVANLLWKMTAKKPAERFVDCNELLGAIDAILEGRGFQPSDPMQGGPRQPGSNGRNPAAGSGQRAATRAGGTRITRGQTPVDRKSRSMAARQQSPTVLFAMLAVGGIAVLAAVVWLALKSNATEPLGGTPVATQPAHPASGTPPVAGPLTPNPVPAPGPVATDISAIVNTASRGLHLSDEYDRVLVEQEMLERLRRPPNPAPNGPAATTPTAIPAGSLTPRAGAERLVHTLTADEKKTARTVLDAYSGKVVLRMPVPPITMEEMKAANIAQAPNDELGKLPVLKMGPPPMPISREVYQGFFLQLDETMAPREKIDLNARIRLLLKVECNDRQPVEYRFLHSTLPYEDATLLGGIMGKMPACEWQLIDSPLMIFEQEMAEKNWFGYASGTGEDYRNKRNITISVSDIIIYNPKP